MVSNRKLFENSFLYTFSGILTKCINFILMPIYTAHLTTYDYGIYSMIGSFTSTAYYIISLGLENVIMRFYNDYKENIDKFAKLIGTCICSILIVDIIFSLLCYRFRYMLSDSILDGISFFPYILIALIDLTCICINTIYRTILKTIEEGRNLTLTSLGMFFISTILTILLVVVLKKGIIGMFVAILFSRFSILLYAAYDLWRHNLIKICIDILLLKKSLKYSLPLIPHQMSMSIATLMSKIFLNKSETLSLVGVYNVATQIAIVVDTFQDSVGQAYRPWLNGILHKNSINKEKQIQEVSEILMYLFSFSFICISFFSFEVIILFFNKNYFEAVKIIPILVLSFSLKAIYYFYIYKCFYFIQTANKIFLISIFSSFINILVSYFLARKYGMYGIAFAQLLSDIIRTITTIILANSQSRIGYRLNILFKILFMSWVVIFIGVFPIYAYSFSKFSWLLFVYKCILIFIYTMFFIYKHKDKIKQFFDNFKIKRGIK